MSFEPFVHGPMFGLAIELVFKPCNSLIHVHFSFFDGVLDVVIELVLDVDSNIFYVLKRFEGDVRDDRL